jgi:DNA-binding NarL/FixJ family response regulator
MEAGAVSELPDRHTETAALDGVLAKVRDGLSGVLVLRGDPGIGKTALLEWAAERARDMQLARVAGVEAETRMGFAGLQRLLVPFLGGLEGLPGPQRQALGSAFGLVEGPPPDRFLVGLAALTLPTDAAAARPVLCLVDDAHWLDQASVEVLGFIARRLYADRVGMVFTVGEGERHAAAPAGLAELVLSGLPAEAAGPPLARFANAPVDGRVSARVVAEVAGNPLAVAELAGELTEAELSGAVPLAWPLRFSGRLEQLYLARVRTLPADTGTLLLVAAAEPAGGQAARQLECDLDAGEAPGIQRLVSWQLRARFRHPLIRSAAYYAATPQARRHAHAALAAVTGPDANPDRRAWHLAEAAPGPDEQVAAEPERSAGRAQARGGLIAAAAFLERSAALLNAWAAASMAGNQAGAGLLLEISRAAARATDEADGQGIEAAAWAQSRTCLNAAILYNGLGRYDDAFTKASQAREHHHVYISPWALPELIEAAVRTGRDQAAAGALDAVMDAFAERARTGLRATGEHTTPRGPGAPRLLTPQEEQIAQLVAEHLTNPEIGARLFISASTVEYHPGKIFRKLGVSSRAEAARSFRDGKGTSDHD